MPVSGLSAGFAGREYNPPSTQQRAQQAQQQQSGMASADVTAYYATGQNQWAPAAAPPSPPATQAQQQVPSSQAQNPVLGFFATVEKDVSSGLSQAGKDYASFTSGMVNFGNQLQSEAQNPSQPWYSRAGEEALAQVEVFSGSALNPFAATQVKSPYLVPAAATGVVLPAVVTAGASAEAEIPILGSVGAANVVKGAAAGAVFFAGSGEVISKVTTGKFQTAEQLGQEVISGAALGAWGEIGFGAASAAARGSAVGRVASRIPAFAKSAAGGALFSGGITAAQGGSPEQIAESAGIGAAVGSGFSLGGSALSKAADTFLYKEIPIPEESLMTRGHGFEDLYTSKMSYSEIRGITEGPESKYEGLLAKPPRNPPSDFERVKETIPESPERAAITYGNEQAEMAAIEKQLPTTRVKTERFPSLMRFGSEVKAKVSSPFSRPSYVNEPALTAKIPLGTSDNILLKPAEPLRLNPAEETGTPLDLSEDISQAVKPEQVPSGKSTTLRESLDLELLQMIEKPSPTRTGFQLPSWSPSGRQVEIPSEPMKPFSLSSSSSASGLERGRIVENPVTRGDRYEPGTVNRGIEARANTARQAYLTPKMERFGQEYYSNYDIALARNELFSEPEGRGLIPSRSDFQGIFPVSLRRPGQLGSSSTKQKEIAHTTGKTITTPLTTTTPETETTPRTIIWTVPKTPSKTPTPVPTPLLEVPAPSFTRGKEKELPGGFFPPWGITPAFGQARGGGRDAWFYREIRHAVAKDPFGIFAGTATSSKTRRTAGRKRK
jgi:hypothetical protein